MTKLVIYDETPEGLLEKDARHLHEVLAGPSLIYVEGQRSEILFVSILLHGNEVTGWEAIRTLLLKYAGQMLPRTLCIFIGNVAAARYGQRCLADQADYNRIWKADCDLPEHAMAREVMAELGKMELFAAIDIHNNTGKNPHYACVNRLEQHFLHLATLFNRTVVYFLKPDTVLSMALARYCPAVTVECGRPGEPHGVMHVIEYLEACLHLAEFPTHAVPAHDLDLFHTVAVVKVAKQMSVGVADDNADIDLLPNIDSLNFNELPAGTKLGYVRSSEDTLLEAWDEQGNEVGSRYFEVKQGELCTAIPVMPSMLTLNRDIIKQDCLCYLMERLAVN